jgi:hypothetical protein
MAGKAGRNLLARQGRSSEVSLNGLSSVLPMHGSKHELKKGTVEAIKKQLGVK